MQAGVVEWFGADIRRILAPNPSPMTGPGTNSYLIGRGAGVVLVDPGPDIPSHIAAIMSALAPGESIGQIVLTHAHIDHTEATKAMVAHSHAPVLAYGPASRGRSAMMAQMLASGMRSGGEGADHDFAPDHWLEDGAEILAPGGAIEVIHTPGHMSGHICLARNGVLFSGDHAMGWASSIASPPDGDMGAYVASLRRLLGRPWELMLPGHGAEVREVTPRLQALLEHRLAREAQIRDALAPAPATARSLTAAIYHDTPAALLPAAERNVLAHLLDLLERSIVSCPNPAAPDAIFQIIKN